MTAEVLASALNNSRTVFSPADSRKTSLALYLAMVQACNLVDAIGPSLLRGCFAVALAKLIWRVDMPYLLPFSSFHVLLIRTTYM